MTPFRRVQAKDVDVQRLQDAVSPIFKQLISKQIIDGFLIEDVTITGGTAYTLNHGLGFPPRGWIVCKKNAESDVWETVSTTPNSTLILNATSTVTISLWVF